MRLNNQVAIITGSGRGIGKGIAEVFAREGAIVVIATIDKEEGRNTAEQINMNGGKAFFIQTDVSDVNSITQMVKEVNDNFGEIDTLVNNAGITIIKPMEEAGVELWDELMNINLRSVFLVSKYVTPLMKKQNNGSIINISSNHAKATIPHAEIYAATKAGINGLTRGMAVSLAEFGIRVNSICPGFTDTPHHQKWLQDKDDPEKANNEIMQMHAANRICQPEDIGKLAVYLASNDSEMMTGEELYLDGGLSTYLFHSKL
ncbi:short-chain dehydrogenase [Virgibacillus indicus]|uniref:Short-chain dehydrogenase n=1 Tax=Virgibacillus indicus TaxID=2024554 RepID=A0A265NA00_9BACI|nr:SDR family oxidoreductase [Virgibacillus indicus]OZU88279.1 short-chain dehydrogenase [Virgibacillus indicus]